MKCQAKPAWLLLGCDSGGRRMKIGPMPMAEWQQWAAVGDVGVKTYLCQRVEGGADEEDFHGEDPRMRVVTNKVQGCGSTVELLETLSRKRFLECADALFRWQHRSRD